MKKRTKVIMLPTDKASDIHLGLEGGHLGGYIYYKNGKLAEERTQPQHLYFTVDEEPKDGEWVIETSNKNLISQFSEQSLNQRSMGCRKIIATTDILRIKEVDSFEFGNPQDEYYVPQIPQSFIEEYCRKGGIDEVDVEYEKYHDGNFINDGKTHAFTALLRPEVSNDNIINIQPIKDSWNREEVEKLCKEAFSCGVRLWEDWEEEDVEMWEKFKKLNLKDKDKALHIGGVSIRLFIFKVEDYTTELVGRYNEEKDCYYVQRGDGRKYEYESYRIEWKRELNVC